MARRSRKKGLSFYYKEMKKLEINVFREVMGLLAGMVIAVFMACVLTYFLGMTTSVVGDSMEPTLQSGQTVYINRFTYLISSPKAGDVVVFLPNGNENSHYYVKRVVAVPGDRVFITGGVLYVNGLVSAYVSEEIEYEGLAGSQITLGSDEYFVIGDDPANSEDSRYADIGFVSAGDILGKVWAHGTSDMAGFGLVK